MEEKIQVSSTVSPENRDPLVLIKWGESKGIITSIDARSRGISLIQAVAIAKCEETIFHTLAKDAKPYKGFGKYKPTKDQQMAANLVFMLRDKHNFTHTDIQPIYGNKHQTGLIKYKWGTCDGLLDLTEATDHATGLIKAAEAAENDSFFFQFFEKNKIADRGEVQGLVNEYRLFKQQKYFENLVDK